MALLQLTKKGIYCAQAKVYIDPWRPVDRALITHGHSDHARWGHNYYLSTHTAKPVIRHRLGRINIESIAYGAVQTINGVKISFHPAGHIIGSAQIRLEYKGEIWVASGDYKLENDGLSEAFEPVQCQHFITESTFGLPLYSWRPQTEVFADINNWWQKNKELGKVSLITAYSLGKAQRLIQGLDTSIGRIYTHGAIENTNEVIRAQGIQLQPTTRITQGITKKEILGNIILAPPSMLNSPWIQQFDSIAIAAASGWMALRNARRRRATDRGFVLSDHADWDALNDAVKATGAEHIYVTHGYSKLYSKWLREQGWDAKAIETEFEGELAEATKTNAEENTES